MPRNPNTSQEATNRKVNSRILETGETRKRLLSLQNCVTFSKWKQIPTSHDQLTCHMRSVLNELLLCQSRLDYWEGSATDPSFNHTNFKIQSCTSTDGSSHFESSDIHQISRIHRQLNGLWESYHQFLQLEVHRVIETCLSSQTSCFKEMGLHEIEKFCIDVAAVVGSSCYREQQGVEKNDCQFQTVLERWKRPKSFGWKDSSSTVIRMQPNPCKKLLRQWLDFEAYFNLYQNVSSSNNCVIRNVMVGDWHSSQHSVKYVSSAYIQMLPVTCHHCASCETVSSPGWVSISENNISLHQKHFDSPVAVLEICRPANDCEIDWSGKIKMMMAEKDISDPTLFDSSSDAKNESKLLTSDDLCSMLNSSLHADATVLDLENLSVEKISNAVTGESYSDLVIISVVDPKTKQCMSLQEATRIGILDRKDNVYVNKLTGEKLPMLKAIQLGYVNVKLVDSLSELTMEHRQQVRNGASSSVAKPCNLQENLRPASEFSEGIENNKSDCLFIDDEVNEKYISCDETEFKICKSVCDRLKNLSDAKRNSDNKRSESSVEEVLEILKLVHVNCLRAKKREAQPGLLRAAILGQVNVDVALGICEVLESYSIQSLLNKNQLDPDTFCLLNDLDKNAEYVLSIGDAITDGRLDPRWLFFRDLISGDITSLYAFIQSGRFNLKSGKMITLNGEEISLSDSIRRQFICPSVSCHKLGSQIKVLKMLNSYMDCHVPLIKIISSNQESQILMTDHPIRNWEHKASDITTEGSLILDVTDFAGFIKVAETGGKVGAKEFLVETNKNIVTNQEDHTLEIELTQTNEICQNVGIASVATLDGSEARILDTKGSHDIKALLSNVPTKKKKVPTATLR